MKKYFTKAEAIERIIDTLEWYSGYYCDLHNEVFNTDYYIIGTWEAEQALKDYGTFKAIGKIQDYEEYTFGKIQDYEECSFGEVRTDLSDPERVANMLWYIIGEDIIYGHDIIDRYLMNRLADDETNSEIIERLQEELGE